MLVLFQLCFPLLLQLACFTGAYPITNVQIPLGEPEEARCDSVSRYTTEWFLSNTLPEYRHELHSNALFYTRGASQSARQLAGASPDQYTSVWEVWPCWLYDPSPDKSNRMRCIHEDKNARMTFYENMSRAFARMARDSATVMAADEKDYVDMPEDGIWGRVELPALRDLTDVESLTKIDAFAARPTSFRLIKGVGEAVKTAIREAMNEVQAIFSRNRSDTSASSRSACNFWTVADDDDHWLDMLW